MSFIWPIKMSVCPWYAKFFTACVVAYAFSPIDLIPDFIPILGYLDDVIIVPLGFMQALRMLPNEVIEEYKEKAEIFWSSYLFNGSVRHAKGPKTLVCYRI